MRVKCLRDQSSLLYKGKPGLKRLVKCLNLDAPCTVLYGECKSMINIATIFKYISFRY